MTLTERFANDESTKQKAAAYDNMQNENTLRNAQREGYRVGAEQGGLAVARQYADEEYINQKTAEVANALSRGTDRNTLIQQYGIQPALVDRAEQQIQNSYDAPMPIQADMPEEARGLSYEAARAQGYAQ